MSDLESMLERNKDFAARESAAGQNPNSNSIYARWTAHVVESRLIAGTYEASRCKHRGKRHRRRYGTELGTICSSWLMSAS